MKKQDEGKPCIACGGLWIGEGLGHAHVMDCYLYRDAMKLEKKKFFVNPETPILDKLRGLPAPEKSDRKYANAEATLGQLIRTLQCCAPELRKILSKAAVEATRNE